MYLQSHHKKKHTTTKKTINDKNNNPKNKTRLVLHIQHWYKNYKKRAETFLEQTIQIFLL